MTIVQKLMTYQNGKHRKWIDAIFIIVGTFLLAFPVNTIYDPMKMVIGGFGGLSIIIKYLLEQVGIFAPVWLTNILLNVPVFLIAYFIFGKDFVAKTFFGAVAFAAWLYIIPTTDIVGGDYLLATAIGGILSGFGIGLVFLTNSTSGGTDMVSAIIHKFLKHHSVPTILMFVDGLIVFCGLFTIGIKNVMYGILTIYIFTKVSDAMLEGLKFGKMVYIISDCYKEIASSIMKDVDRGVTAISAKGMYTEREKNMLFCVVSKKEIVLIKEVVAKIDPKAFVIVSDVREVFGEGFGEYKQDNAVN